MNSIQWPFPLVVNKAKDAFLFDVDGNKLIDYMMTSGPCMLGHNYPEIRDYVIKILQEDGPATGLMCEYELLAAREICKHMKSVEKVRFYQSGTEANMALARVARVYTGKKKIIKVGGSYQGWADQFIVDMHIPGTGAVQAHGVPPEYYCHTLSVFPNDIKGLEKTIIDNENKGGVAAVIYEAIGGDSGTFPPSPDYNKQVREICDKYGVLLAYDEVVTGFRIAMGGAQEYYGIKADLSSLGKIVGHEYPSAGALGGRTDIMQCIIGKGKGKDSDVGEKAYTAGTMAGTNITCAAAYKAIQCIEKTNAIEIAAQVADKLVIRLNEVFDRYNLPFFTFNIKSIIQLRMTGFYTVDLHRPDALQQIGIHRQNGAYHQILLALENINTLQAIRMYTCLKHNDAAIIEDTVRGFENFCKKLTSQ